MLLAVSGTAVVAAVEELEKEAGGEEPSELLGTWRCEFATRAGLRSSAPSGGDGVKGKTSSRRCKEAFHTCHHPPLPPLPMGSKKNKSKNPFSSSPSPTNVVDDDLMDDLLTELDSRDKTVREESAAVLDEIETSQAIIPDNLKSGSKNRFRARQVRPFHHHDSSMVTSLSSRKGKEGRSTG